MVRQPAEPATGNNGGHSPAIRARGGNVDNMSSQSHAFETARAHPFPNADVTRTSHGLFPDPDAASPCSTRLSRPSARARLPVLDRDVGALLLLRDALAARALHGE